MHLLAVNTTFAYDAIYALGVVTTFDRFMDGYRPEGDRASIFSALCQALNSRAEQYRGDAEALFQEVKTLDVSALLQALSSPDSSAPERLGSALNSVRGRSPFKYSRLFGVGLITLIEVAQPEALKPSDASTELLDKVASSLGLPLDKLQKDLETYRSNLEKMAQAKIVMDEAVQAERKKREQREQERQAKADETPDTKALEASKVSL